MKKKDLEWLTLGRTVLLPKMKDLSSEKDYRPIKCLNTSDKIFTGVLRSNVKEHVIKMKSGIRARLGHERGYSRQ